MHTHTHIHTHTHKHKHPHFHSQLLRLHEFLGVEFGAEFPLPVFPAKKLFSLTSLEKDQRRLMLEKYLQVICSVVVVVVVVFNRGNPTRASRLNLACVTAEATAGVLTQRIYTNRWKQRCNTSAASAPWRSKVFLWTAQRPFSQNITTLAYDISWNMSRRRPHRPGRP